MIFLFSLGDLDVEQKFRRSFLLFDRKNNGKISKDEMVDALDKLEMLEMEHNEKGKLIIPDEVENIFSLMDFAHEGKITEEEFLKAARHYRKLGRMLTIFLLERSRTHVQDSIKKFMEEEKEKAAKRKEKRKRILKRRMGSKVVEEEVEVDSADEIVEDVEKMKVEVVEEVEESNNQVEVVKVEEEIKE